MRPLSTVLSCVVALMFAGSLLQFISIPAHTTALSTADDSPEVTFAAPDKVEAYDFLEVTLTVKKPTAKNPFTDVAVTGSFQCENDAAVRIEGF